MLKKSKSQTIKTDLAVQWLTIQGLPKFLLEKRQTRMPLRRFFKQCKSTVKQKRKWICPSDISRSKSPIHLKIPTFCQLKTPTETITGKKNLCKMCNMCLKFFALLKSYHFGEMRVCSDNVTSRFIITIQIIILNLLLYIFVSLSNWHNLGVTLP